MIIPLNEYSNAGFFKLLKFKLLNIIANGDVVVLNAKFKVEEKVGYDDEPIVRIENVKGGLVQGCNFPLFHDHVLIISQVKK